MVVADDRQPAVRVRLRHWLGIGEGMHAPAVLPYEVANVLARQVFDGILEEDEVPDIWSDLAALGLVLHPFDLTRDGREVAAITARLRKRHATDSAYVALAQRLGTTVWTLDGSLARNASDLGLPVRLVS
ncbi:MAG: type II toxin-antitoxin system VapC family toxin [Marmoricola sp.]